MDELSIGELGLDGLAADFPRGVLRSSSAALELPRRLKFAGVKTLVAIGLAVAARWMLTILFCALLLPVMLVLAGVSVLVARSLGVPLCAPRHLRGLDSL